MASGPSTFQVFYPITFTGTDNSAASPTSTETSQRREADISPGAAVGIGVGSAAAGVLLALFIAYFFMRRRPPGSKSSTPSDGSLSGSNNKLPQVPLKALVHNRDAPSLPTLPPPIQNDELVRMFTTLSTMIQNHAYSFFSQGSGQAKTVSNPEAVKVVLGDDSPIITQEVIELLNGPQRVIGVRFLLGWAIMSNIDPHASPDKTLLPRELIALLHTLTQNANPDAHLLSKWRHLTGTLLTPTQTPNLTRLTSLLDAILAPLSSSGDNVLNRKSNLEQIVKLGAQNGYMLLTQPTAWRFDWTRREDGGLVVFPELVQTGDERGGKIEIERGCGVGRVVRVERGVREEV
ncbi:hypothetical protein PRZ48_014599 [Zasmidium cellare]|uniref:Uncharacterized protein n=1 Tax=Zasmidium cellare TaxID=395010 RepID=A0ABR0DZ73_ZASCE|nr:hypothetical protein PRZ48_014599 [Zasmidium cellare]